MVTIKIKATGEVKEVLRNEAHTLIDSGKAVLYVKGVPQSPASPPIREQSYNTRQIKSRFIK